MDDGDDMETSLDGATSKRACDSCRTRKIRCDRLVPCSNCKASKLTCMNTAPTQKAQRQRVHISEEYEKKIDRIEDRLAGIENVLESLATKLSDLHLRRDSTEHSSQCRSSRKDTNRSPGTIDEAPTPAPFEGETTINTQSDYAREILARAVDTTPSVGQNAEVQSALRSLGDLVKHHGHLTSPTVGNLQTLVNPSLADIDPENLSKPPWDMIEIAVKRACDFPTMSLGVIFPFLRMKNFHAIIDDAYHNPSQCGALRRMLAFGALHIIFEEYAAFPPPGMNSGDNRTYIVQCQLQIEVAMSQLDMFMPASYENIMALMLGGSWAVEMCKPSLTSMMVSIAARLCQTLGYHRYQTMKDDSDEDRNTKTQMFWIIYLFDKTLSLRTGRPSFIQDWDISLPFFNNADVVNDVPDRNQMLTYWVKLARVQGQTYEKLFSPAAFLRSHEERSQTVVELVDYLNEAWYERGDARITDLTLTDQFLQQSALRNRSPNETELPSRRKRSTHGLTEADIHMRRAMERVNDVFFYADSVMHYSTCTLIQRAVSPDIGNTTLNQECLASARAALLAHSRCSARFNVKGEEDLWIGYLHWSILQAPFTPFIVIFCNTIQNADAADLDLLKDFVASLEGCRTMTEGAHKLHKMCNLFLRVAMLYMQAKIQDTTIQPQTLLASQPNYYTAADGSQFDLHPMTEFDPYLSALGLMPHSSWPMASFTAPQATDPMIPYTQGDGLGGIPTMDMSGMGLVGNGQNSVQDWFSGSTYLMNLMEVGDDSQMVDFNNM
ncbi:fungal-specific transcription factor domain-containing protein [Ampelomyces quisqualis]|uniref:Fungal-specific transcription factor domain-containing protein n=1 Tax=Ampelomyces quisqualis TaxID=50730 RepID=A0A6A5QBK9_AMPQU|nr:fungal-specific transcription factor domain-containing protein [Ampelomyces quisqualis]